MCRSSCASAAWSIAGGACPTAAGTGASGSWFDTASPRQVTYRGVIFDGTQFLAVGDAEVVVRSIDGTSWQQVAVGATPWSQVKQLYRGTAER